MADSGVIYMISSIYKPYKDYIGSTVNYLSRRRAHKARLVTKTHNNPKLQNHVNKYGVADFEFRVLEKGIPDHELLKKKGIIRIFLNHFLIVMILI